ncbi:uncharacterized protein LOC129605297 [Condylostylus longicornis]|uniref:uncharacterized protein LOC129605297 n=1 Tax=Condylostylus longicornis TaxID=2530218 RepID=UPI00244DC986|nr:uncharacterized protein LOC129605297 [Condylostylus longicornis]
MTTAKISDWGVKILLSKADEKYVKELQLKSELDFENKQRPVFTSEDKSILSKLNAIEFNLSNCSAPLSATSNSDQSKVSNTKNSNITLDLNRIISLYHKFHSKDETLNQQHCFHDILGASKLIIPKNEIIPRNPQLEERCKKLRMEQENVEYANMTKNVDSARKSLPEDTISYQIKSLNKQLIAIFQFIVSVVTGFAFGFIGLELIFGGMEFGFRLLLGIICALTIALAEIYFLAKKLSEYDEFIDSPKHAYITPSKKNN